MDDALRRDQDEPGEFLNLNIGLEKFGGSETVADKNVESISILAQTVEAAARISGNRLRKSVFMRDDRTRGKSDNAAADLSNWNSTEFDVKLAR